MFRCFCYNIYQQHKFRARCFIVRIFIRFSINLIDVRYIYFFMNLLPLYMAHGLAKIIIAMI